MTHIDRRAHLDDVNTNDTDSRGQPISQTREKKMVFHNSLPPALLPPHEPSSMSSTPPLGRTRSGKPTNSKTAGWSAIAPPPLVAVSPPPPAISAAALAASMSRIHASRASKLATTANGMNGV